MATVLICSFNDGSPDFRGASHAPSCKWALGAANSTPKNRVAPSYVSVNVNQVPASTGRCSRCGGGR